MRLVSASTGLDPDSNKASLNLLPSLFPFLHAVAAGVTLEHILLQRNTPLVNTPFRELRAIVLVPAALPMTQQAGPLAAVMHGGEPMIAAFTGLDLTPQQKLSSLKDAARDFPGEQVQAQFAPLSWLIQHAAEKGVGIVFNQAASDAQTVVADKDVSVVWSKAKVHALQQAVASTADSKAAGSKQP